MNFAIFILNWNGYKDTFECVSSILKNNSSNLNIFILDNGSKKDYPMLKKVFSKNRYIHVLKSKKNMGFAGGHNYLASKVNIQNYDYVFLLNNDTILKSNFFKEMEKSILKFKSSKFKIFIPTIYYYHKNLTKSKLWRAGDFKKISENEVRVRHPTGCGVIIDSNLIKKYGLFKQEFFAYAEELEYFYRMKKLGFKFLYVPKALLWHKVVEFEDSPFKVYMSIRNKWYYWSQMTNLDKVPYFLYLIGFYLPKKFLIYSQNKNNLKYFFKGNKDGLNWITKGIKPKNPFIKE